MKRTKNKITVSLVIPFFNEADVLPELLSQLKPVIQSVRGKYNFTIYLVDDGSSDRSLEVLSKYTNQSVRVLQLSRNFGHQAALLAGLEASTGEVIISMDADLQHPPHFIPELLAAYEQGYEVVLTQRIDTIAISPLKRLTSTLFYRIINLLSPVRIQTNGSDFRLLQRNALDALLSMPEKKKIFAWHG